MHQYQNVLIVLFSDLINKCVLILYAGFCFSLLGWYSVWWGRGHRHPTRGEVSFERGPRCQWYLELKRTHFYQLRCHNNKESRLMWGACEFDPSHLFFLIFFFITETCLFLRDRIGIWWGGSWKMSTILTDRCWKVNKPSPLGQLYCDFRRAETYYSTANLQLLIWTVMVTSGWETKITSHTKVKDSGFSFFLFICIFLLDEMSLYDRRRLVKMKLGRSGQQTFSGITDSWQSIKGYNYCDVLLPQRREALIAQDCEKRQP